MATKKKNVEGALHLRSRLQILIPSLVVLVSVAMTAFYIDLQQQRLSREAARNGVEESLGLIRTKVEANINANIRLLQGLVAVIETEPYITQDRFAALSGSLLANPSQIRNIIAAPNLITTFVYPYERNKGFIGMRLLPPSGATIATQQLSSGKIVISGPMPLKNGSSGLIVSLPVEIANDMGQSVFWGGLAGIVDLARLYDDSGLSEPDLPISVTISDVDNISGRPTVIYGDEHLLADDPVTMVIDLGNKHWTISAVPTLGWDSASKPDTFIRSMIAVMAGLIAGTVIWVALLMRERQKNYAALHQREEELRAMSHRLGAALESSRIGVWEMDVTSGLITWDERVYQLYGLPRGAPVTMDLWRTMVDPQDVAAIEEGMRNAVQTLTSYTGHFRARRPDGRLTHFRTVGTAFRNLDGEVMLMGVN